MGGVTEKDPDDEIFKGPATLGSDGRLEQRLERVEAAGAGPDVPRLASDEELELAPKAPRAIEARVETYRTELHARARRPWAIWLVIAALALGVAALGALLHFKPKLDLESLDGVRESTLLDALTAGGESPPIIVSSTPTGATILIGGKAVGETPWAGENRWRGETLIVLKLAGYQPWEGKLKGGQPLTLDIRLKK